jgi:uncharacterized membrane protein
MKTNRLEAFSDGVIAIIITVMVLQLKPPASASLIALKSVFPTLLCYVLSFIYLGIYWNNHHHLLQATQQVNGRILWANLHLLFWLSLIPFVTDWMGENHFAAVTMSLYGINLFMAAVAYFILQSQILAKHGKDSLIAKAIGKDYKGRISLALYLSGIIFASVKQWIAGAIYVFVALMWLVPDTRIEKTIDKEPKNQFEA